MYLIPWHGFWLPSFGVWCVFYVTDQAILLKGSFDARLSMSEHPAVAVSPILALRNASDQGHPPTSHSSY